MERMNDSTAFMELRMRDIVQTDKVEEGAVMLMLRGTDVITDWGTGAMGWWALLAECQRLSNRSGPDPSQIRGVLPQNNTEQFLQFQCDSQMMRDSIILL